MLISWIKAESDHQNFKIPERLGFDVFYIKREEEIDQKIDELIIHHYHTIFITKDLASFSQKINKEYLQMNNVEIIISVK